MKFLLLISLLAAPVAADNYTRFTAQFTPEAHRDEQAYPCPMIIGYGDVAQMLYSDMTDDELWFIEQELAFLNDGVWDRLNMTNPLGIVSWSMTLTVPVYQRTSQFIAGDIRNWHVAVMKGCSHGGTKPGSEFWRMNRLTKPLPPVSPALLIAIRTHENPLKKRDRYALGVGYKKWTNIWTQYDWGAAIIARIAKAQGWSPMEPTRPRLKRLALVYVGQGKRSADHWSRNVWELYQRALP